jgi:hypothetical protein
LTLKMLIQLVNPGFKKGGSHPGLFCWIIVDWQWSHILEAPWLFAFPNH